MASAGKILGNENKILPWILGGCLMLPLGCIPKQEQKSQGGTCRAGEGFNAKTRSCYTLPPAQVSATLKYPVNTLAAINLDEDEAPSGSPTEVQLTYSDPQGGQAISCDVDYTSSRHYVTMVDLDIDTEPDCDCLGGLCTFLINTVTDQSGVDEFKYSVTNTYGSSTKTSVRVQIWAKDDNPVLTSSPFVSTVGYLPNITLTERVSTSAAAVEISMPYSDVDGDVPGSSDYLFSGAAFSTYITTSTFSCSSSTCFIYFQPKINTNTGNTTYNFTYKIRANSVWSDTRTFPFQITSTHSLPEITSSTPSSVGTINEGFSDAQFYFNYHEYDAYAPSCRFVNDSNTVGIDQGTSTCTCTVPNSSGDGTCTMVVDYLSPTHLDVNKNSTSTSFKMRYELYTSTGSSTQSVFGNYNFTSLVQAVNDVPTLTSTHATFFTPASFEVGGLENQTISIYLKRDYGIVFDEGGGEDEDAQTVLIKVYSQDENILKSSDIKIYNATTGTLLGTGSSSTFVTIDSTSVSADSVALLMQLLPQEDQSGDVKISVYAKDSLGDVISGIYKEFQVEFTNINNSPTIHLQRRTCNYNSSIPTEVPSCSSVNSTSGCLSDRSPSTLGFTPTSSEAGALFYDWFNHKCYSYMDSDGDADNEWYQITTSCNISKSRTETGCASLGVNCIGRNISLTTLNATYVPANTDSYYYDIYNKKCYVSYSDSGTKKWKEYSLPQPVSKPNVSIKATQCSSTYADSSGTSSPLNSVTPSKSGAIYLNTASSPVACYFATSTASSSWEKIYNYAQCNADRSSSTQPVKNTILNQTGVTPTREGEVYQVTSDHGSCYYAMGLSAYRWVTMKNSCPVSSKVDEPNCPNKFCLGSLPPRGNSPATKDIIPSAVNHYYYDFTTYRCYRSVGTANAQDWVIYGTIIPDQKINEAGELVLNDLVLDEGGGSGEDSDDLSLDVSILDDSDPAQAAGTGDVLFPTENLGVYVDATSTTGENSYTLEMDAINDFSVKNTSLHFKHFKGQIGRSQVQLTLTDGHSSSSFKTAFSILSYPITYRHNGWKNIMSTGRNIDYFNNLIENPKVEIKWSAFTLQASDVDDGTNGGMLNPAVSDYSVATILGYNIYRRMASENFDFTRPLNGDTFISGSSLQFTDTLGTTNTIPGPTSTSSVYYYTVLPVVDMNGEMAYTSQEQRTIRVVVPPDNMAFVHRWMVNQEVCKKLHSSSDQQNSNRCLYNGPGETSANSVSYYDVGYDLLVDRFETGCPFTKDTAQYWYGNSAPSGGSSGHIYYQRNTGHCWLNYLSTWRRLVEMFDNSTSFKSYLSTTSMRKSKLPPLVNLTSSMASTICQSSTTSIYLDRSLSTYTSTHGLPSRKEQIAYAAWDENSLSDTVIDAAETGLSLNAGGSGNAKCNSSNADGLEDNYSDADTVSSNIFYSLPGSYTSNTRDLDIYSDPIRSLITGSTFTKDCKSRYGVQDAVGNVHEFAIERLLCGSVSTCFATSSLETINGSTSFFTSDSYWEYVSASSSTKFGVYFFDGKRGPCVELAGACSPTDPLTDWKFSEKSNNASFFLFPVGLPGHSDFKQNYSSGTVDDFFLDIGPSSGITSNALHNDSIEVNSDVIYTYGASTCSAVMTGGSYLTGSGAGRYSIKFMPCQDTLYSTTRKINYSSLSRPAYPAYSDTAADVGMRCVRRIQNSSFSEDPASTSSKSNPLR